MFESFGNNLSVIMILVAFWTLPWKGVALWRAANRGEKKWFIAILIFNTLAILEIIYIFGFSKRPKKESGEEISKPSGFDSTPFSKKEQAKSRLLESIKNRGQITNNDVQILLGVSDATATNYLEELEKEGKITQHGETGRGVFYTPR